MKAFVLAAGEGRRLRPLTERVPKCLVPIRGQPLLGLWLDLLEAYGVTEALVNRHHLSDEVDRFVRSQGRRIRVDTRAAIRSTIVRVAVMICER